MTLDKGDYEQRVTLTLDDGGNSVSEGDAVTFDGSGNITPTSANDDALVGIAHKVSDNDDKVTVLVSGTVVTVEADGSISKGDTVIPSGGDNGTFVSHTGGMYINNTDSSANDIAANHPYALDSAGDGENFRAVMR